MVRGSVPNREGLPEPEGWRDWRAPAAFNTVRYSEKMLEANGITVETLDLSEVLGESAG